MVQESISNMESMQTLVNAQNEQVVKILNLVKIISPQLLGADATKNEDGLNTIKFITYIWVTVTRSLYFRAYFILFFTYISCI